ncbi:MAG: hypothetical protein MUF66_10280 [Gammaproteobacteria bacterium]|nr:hypothetical protein [Gammaproteobacteria bacterium]
MRWLGLLAALLLAGCGTLDVRPHDATYQSSLGRVAVVAAADAPGLRFEGFAHGKGEGALAGAGAGFGGCLAGVGSSGCSGELCGLMLLLMLGVCGVTGVVGGVAGAVTAPSASDVEAAQATLTQALEIRTIQESLRAAVESAALARGARLVVVPPELARQAATARDYRPLAVIGADTVVVIALTRAGTTGSGINAPVAAYLEAAVQVVHAGDNKLQYADEYAYRGRRHTFAEWGADGGRPLLEELGRGCRALGAHVYDIVFELYPYPERSARRGADSGLAPLSPPTRGETGADGPLARVLDWKAVDSLQPTLKWLAFPGASDVAAAPEEMARVKGVRYDLLIARHDGGEPGEIVYRREGLAAPEHRLETSLEPDTLYYWTVRAHFDLDDRPRVTQWASMDFWPTRTVDGTPRLSWKFLTPPTPFSYRFRTPRPPARRRASRDT